MFPLYLWKTDYSKTIKKKTISISAWGQKSTSFRPPLIKFRLI